MNQMLRLTFLLVVLSGCATVYPGVQPEQAEAMRNAKVLVLIPQDTIVNIPVSDAATRQFGLLGTVLEAQANSKASRETENLRKAITDIDFRSDYTRALRSSGIFVNPSNIELVHPVPEDFSDVRARIASAKGAPVVLVEVSYNLDASYTILDVESRISLWSDNKATMVTSINYRSQPVTLDFAFESWRVGVPKWAANGARYYRLALREGIDESMRMLRLAVLTRPSREVALHDKVVEVTDYPLLLTVKGKLIRNSADRQILLTDRGQYYSVSTGPTYALTRERYLTPPAGYGRLFYYRPTNQPDSRIVQPSIYLNNTGVGKLYHGGFGYIDLLPGRYTVALKYESIDVGSGIHRSPIERITPVQVTVQPGTRQFLKFTGYGGFLTPVDSLRLIDESTAETEMSPLKLGNR